MKRGGTGGEREVEEDGAVDTGEPNGIRPDGVLQGDTGDGVCRCQGNGLGGMKEGRGQP